MIDVWKDENEIDASKYNATHGTCRCGGENQWAFGLGLSADDDAQGCALGAFGWFLLFLEIVLVIIPCSIALFIMARLGLQVWAAGKLKANATASSTLFTTFVAVLTMFLWGLSHRLQNFSHFGHAEPVESFAAFDTGGEAFRRNFSWYCPAIFAAFGIVAWLGTSLLWIQVALASQRMKRTKNTAKLVRNIKVAAAVAFLAITVTQFAQQQMISSGIGLLAVLAIDFSFIVGKKKLLKVLTKGGTKGKKNESLQTQAKLIARTANGIVLFTSMWVVGCVFFILSGISKTTDSGFYLTFHQLSFLALRGPLVGACWFTMRYAETLLQKHVGTKNRAVKPASYAVADSSVSAEEGPSQASGGAAAIAGASGGGDTDGGTNDEIAAASNAADKAGQPVRLLQNTIFE